MGTDLEMDYDEEVEKNRYDDANEKQFVMMMSDLNFDGRTDFGDR
jgi:hypothetical protein